MPPFKNIAITSRADFKDKENVLKEIVEIAEKAGATVCVDEKNCNVASLKTCKQFGELKGFDLIIVVGGDGTILRAVKEMQDFSAPLLTVNRGTIGFLTECDTAECSEVLPPLIKGEGVIEERQLLTCAVVHDGKKIEKGHALNEIVISQGAISRLIQLKTRINDQLLATFRADGIILATATGSTAYNLAAGGPILHPSSTDIILTPINAHTFSQKPLAVPANSLIDVEIFHRESPYEDVKVSLTIDGQSHHDLSRGDHVLVTTHKQKVKFLKRKEDTFYETLRGKLGWGE